MAKIYIILLITILLHTINSENLIGAKQTEKKCLKKILQNNLLNNFKNINGQTLNLKVPVNTVLKRNQPKRFTIKLRESSPLTIRFNSQQSFSNIEKSLYFNNSINLARTYKNESKEIFYPCAIQGQYDIFLNLRHNRRTRINIEAHDQHPFAEWPLLNRSTEVRLRTQNRIQKKQMILKWSKSQLDVHAVHYCLIISSDSPKINFCKAVGESLETSLKSQNTCQHPVADLIWFRQRNKIKFIDTDSTNVVCTGKKSQQIVKGLIPNMKYYINIFGIHTQLRNLPFVLRSSAVWFNRTHPNILKENILNVEKISGMNGISVFSFKVPHNTSSNQLRYLILPCGGSQINAKILKKRKELLAQNDTYTPTYITLNNIIPGGRYILRISPSNEDEELKANKVGIAVTLSDYFYNLPQLPENITVFELRSTRGCKHTRIAWYPTPEVSAQIKYCIIILTLPKSNRSSIDNTNYCMDFGKKISKNDQFYSYKCVSSSESPIETTELLNLIPGNSYLVYVTLHSKNGIRPLPYQSLKINFNSNNKHCDDEMDDESLVDTDKNENIPSSFNYD